MVKKIVSQSASLHTLDMFSSDENAARRDPEQSEIINVSEEHDFPLQRCYAPDGHELYAVQDWIAGIAKTDQPRVMWQQIIKRTVSTKDTVSIKSRCVKLPYKATNGRTYQMDYADGETLYLVTQQMDTNTGIRNQVLAHLAKTGAFVDAARRDPEQAEIAINLSARQNALDRGEDSAWIAVREMGKVTRKQLTALILNISPNARLDIATNKLYEAVLGANADGLNAQLGLKPKSNPRDRMSRLGLIYVMAGEEAVRLHLQGFREDEIVPPTVIYQTITTVASIVGVQAHDVAEQLQVNIVTGRRLMGEGKR